MNKWSKFLTAALVLVNVLFAWNDAGAAQQSRNNGYYIDNGDRSGGRTYVQPHQGVRERAPVTAPYLQATHYDRGSRQHSQITTAGRGFSWSQGRGWPYPPMIYGD